MLWGRTHQSEVRRREGRDAHLLSLLLGHDNRHLDANPVLVRTMSTGKYPGDRVVLVRLPRSVNPNDPDDDVFRKCLGRELSIVAVEDDGNLELDVRPHSDRFISIFVPPDCVE